MTKNWSPAFLLISLFVLIASALTISKVGRQSKARRLQVETDSLVYNKWKLPRWPAETWCEPPVLPRLDYKKCDRDGIINIIPLTGGLTNALKIILLSALYSLEKYECFTIDESVGHLKKRRLAQHEFGSFLQRYFEPIGLPFDHPWVEKAKAEGRTRTIDPIPDIFRKLDHIRVHGTNHTIPLVIQGARDGHFLKKVALRRLWRPLAPWRELTCRKLEAYGLEEEFIAFSVRRGDKNVVEHYNFTDPFVYVEEADKDVENVFGGIPPKIFVATDDCSVMDEFRLLRPHWTFTSECDKATIEQKGFALSDVKEWTPAQTDEHFSKFLREMYALAMAKVFIGVSYTNVAWWAYFMRLDRHSFRLIDNKKINLNSY